MSVHASGGDRSSPSHVYCRGMIKPSLKAELASFILSHFLILNQNPLNPSPQNLTEIHPEKDKIDRMTRKTKTARDFGDKNQ